jgi:hypothetical protein
MMLGVRRAGATNALHILEGRHLIKARRGLITVTDRNGLEALSDRSYGLCRLMLQCLGLALQIWGRQGAGHFGQSRLFATKNRCLPGESGARRRTVEFGYKAICRF